MAEKADAVGPAADRCSVVYCDWPNYTTQHTGSQPVCRSAVHPLVIGQTCVIPGPVRRVSNGRGAVCRPRQQQQRYVRRSNLFTLHRVPGLLRCRELLHL